MLKFTFHNTTKPLPVAEEPLPIAELSFWIDPPIPKTGICETYPSLMVQVTSWSVVGDSTTSELSFPLMGGEWPEVTGTLSQKGRQIPSLQLELPTGHTVNVPAELKRDIEMTGPSKVSPMPSKTPGKPQRAPKPSAPAPLPGPVDDPGDVFKTITALANAKPTDWPAAARYLEALGWQLDGTGQLPDVIARKQFKPGPEIAAYVPQALYIEMGFSVGFTAAANIIHARQGAASTLIPPPSPPSDN